MIIVPMTYSTENILYSWLMTIMGKLEVQSLEILSVPLFMITPPELSSTKELSNCWGSKVPPSHSTTEPAENPGLIDWLGKVVSVVSPTDFLLLYETQQVQYLQYQNKLNPTVGGVFTNLSIINQHKSTILYNT